MTAQVAPATPDVALGAALERFEKTIQTWLDAPLDAARVLEWTRLRALNV